MKFDLIGFAVIAGLSAWGGWELCASYGKAARELSKYQREIVEKNKAIDALNLALERERAEDAAKAAAEDKSFSEALPGLGKCILDEAQAIALNRIGAE